MRFNSAEIFQLILFAFNWFFLLFFVSFRNVIEPMILMVVGNKIDLEKQRAVSREEAFLYASSINGSYFETSAINGGRGIEQVFLAAARGLLNLSDSSDCSSIKRYESTDSILNIHELNMNGMYFNLSYCDLLEKIYQNFGFF